MRKYLLSIIASLIVCAPLMVWGLSGSDNFNRSNAFPIDGSWTNIQPFGSGVVPEIVSNHVQASSTSNEAIAYFTGYTSAANQRATVTLTTFDDPSFDQFAGVVLRASGDGATSAYYACIARKYESGGQTSAIYINLNDTYPGAIASESATTWANGDTLTCEMSGSNAILKRNGVTLLTAPPDTTITSGQPGIMLYQTNNAALTVLDDYSSTDIAAALAATRRRPIEIR